MAVHTIAFAMSVLSAGVLQAITPVPDATVTENGTLIYVPAKYNKVVAIGAVCASSSFSAAALHAPSLREMFFPSIDPLINSPSFTSGNSVERHFTDPLVLETNEGLEFFADGGGDGTTPQVVTGVVWLSDGPIQPAKGKSYKLSASSTIATVPNAWKNGPLVFSQVLPVGTYQILGLRAFGTGLIAVRLVFIGASAVTRPGVPGMPNIRNTPIDGFMSGEFGVLGSFNSITPPSIDVLGGNDVAQTYEFDLIKTG